MKFWNRRKSEKPAEEFRSIYDNYEPVFGGLSYGTYSAFQSSKALTLSACYRAVNLISDAIASLEMKLYEVDKEGYKSENYTNSLYSLLCVEPNPNMGISEMFKLMITSILLRGNAYIRINRDDRFIVKSLQFVNPDSVTITTVNDEIKYVVAGQKGLVNNSDMIHIKNFPQMNSHYGISTISYAMHTLEISFNSETHARNWFKGGANFWGIFTSKANLTPQQEKQLGEKLRNSSNAETGNPNGIVIMGGMGESEFKTLSVSPKDSQLLETRQFNVLDIARFFSVNPILLFDNSNAKYANSENAQLDFLNTTLLPIIIRIENEFNRKLILPSQRRTSTIRFDLENLLRADMNSQAKFHQVLFGMGVENGNQVAKVFNLPKIEGEGGNKHYISTNLQDSSNMIVNTTISIDNKLLGDNSNSTTTTTTDGTIK